MYRGIIAIAAFIIALISWFFTLAYPIISSIKDKRLIIRIAALPIFISVALLIALLKDKYGFPGCIPTDTLNNIIIVTIICLFALGFGPLFASKNRSFLPLCSNILTIITFVIIISFSEIAYKMWLNASVGSVRYGDDMELAKIHSVFIIISIILLIVLGVRTFKSSALPNWISIISSVIYTICINISFFYTYPRSGDEGIMLWMFIFPVFLFVDLILIVMIIIFSIVSASRQISNTARYDSKILK